MTIEGPALIGASDVHSATTFTAIGAATGEPFGVAFAEAGVAEVERACSLADAAFEDYADSEPALRARFLESIADGIAADQEAIVERAMRESGLPEARLRGEIGRTTGQLRMFAAVVREGAWAQVTIDPALPERQPAPRPDLRRRHVAIGPAAVFGASNFPLAFSVAGGDTASALAAGCPVVVKGHPAHPGTGELVARAIRAAAAACGLHEGVFSYLPGTTNDLGQALVSDPRIKAVGFTGSRTGGLALVRAAAARPEPIPVYAEMSSINPVILLPAALKARGAAIATGYVQSLTMGAGQFCTNPGIVIGIDGPDLDAFAAATGDSIAASPAQIMLTTGIRTSFERGVEVLEQHVQVETIGQGRAGDTPHQARSAVFRTDARTFMADSSLSREVFGAASIVIAAADMDEVAAVIGALEGQLTATLMIDPEDEPAAARLIPKLARKAGRILANGWPTGVEVSPAMVHGGPFPATSDVRTTSVGTLAIDRFLRPICYQNLGDALLPEVLRSDNPWHVARRIDGVLQAQD